MEIYPIDATKRRGEREKRKREKEGRIVSREGWESGRNVRAFREKCVKRECVSGMKEKEQKECGESVWESVNTR